MGREKELTAVLVKELIGNGGQIRALQFAIAAIGELCSLIGVVADSTDNPETNTRLTVAISKLNDVISGIAYAARELAKTQLDEDS